MPNGVNNRMPVSYAVNAMGPTGREIPAPGNIPQISYQMPDSLPLEGNSGMSTGRGGGRNKSKGKK